MKVAERGLYAFVLMALLMYLSGCAVRCSVTPIQAEEIVQKSTTNQLWDWMFNKETK